MKDFYKDKPCKYDSIVAIQDFIFKYAKFVVQEPILYSINSDGFYAILTVSLSFEDFSYSFDLFSGM